MRTLTPETLLMVDAIARHGSFARAARELDKVPSAITYAVRRLEDDLDVLLFDRSGHRAVLTPAGAELLREGRLLLHSLDELANRVRRVATGWEPELRIAVSAVLPWAPLYDVIADFHALASHTRLRFSIEVLSGNWDALASARADLVIGADGPSAPSGGFQARPLGRMGFAFCVAPHHPLAQAAQPLAASDIAAHCAVAVADTTHHLAPLTRGLLASQQMLVMPDMQAKIEAQARGLGCGYVPRPLARPYLERGVLVELATGDGVPLEEQLVYAWRPPVQGEALKWWLGRLQSERLCQRLLGEQPEKD